MRLGHRLYGGPGRVDASGPTSGILAGAVVNEDGKSAIVNRHADSGTTLGSFDASVILNWRTASARSAIPSCVISTISRKSIAPCLPNNGLLIPALRALYGDRELPFRSYAIPFVSPMRGQKQGWPERVPISDLHIGTSQFPFVEH